jgi:hypothetical protein
MIFFIMEVHEVNQTQVSHMVQVRTEGPEVPEAARLKGQKLLAQGSALGNYGSKPVAL